MAIGLRRSRRDTQDGARSSGSSPTSRPASPRERRPRARPRSSPPTRRATRQDEVAVEVMRYDSDDNDEPLDKAGLYLDVRDSLDRGMLETEEGDQDDADAGAEESGIGAGRERRGLEGALGDALR